MTIESVQAIALTYPEPHQQNAERHLTLVRIADSSGHVGLG